VCAFGFLGPTKLNDRLVRAWSKSDLAKDVRCRLVFVGKNDPGPYGASLEAAISSSSIRGQIQITGFAERELFERYLAAADLGVQLRAQSRGETSGAVLDCMAYGVPVLLNANGSMDEYSVSEVFKLPNEIDDNALVGALEKLYGDEALRKTYCQAGINRIRDQHTPQLVAGRYQEIIEDVYRSKPQKQEYWNLVQEISAIPNREGSFESDLAAAAKALSVFMTTT
jgi:glycosyltransferase involved in cell wall biosynthesis